MKFLLLFLIALNAFGQASNPNDTLKIGKKSSGADKGLIFETNDGVLNKTLKVNPTSKSLIWSGNDLQIGDGASVNDKELVLDPASGASVKWDGTKSKLQFSNDGSTYKDIGSGSGGGDGGINGFISDLNPNAEDGLTGWTASAGTFALDTADPLEGEQSFAWTPAAQNDTLTSPVIDVNKDSLKGRSCQADIEYIGGDSNLTLKVLNGDDEELASLELPAHTISSKESLFFLCPSDADIVADADKGNLRIRLENTGASASALIKWDLSYLGTLRGLVETQLPDVMSARLANNGVTASIASSSADFIDSVNRAGQGLIDVTFKAGYFTVTPSVVTEVDAGTGSSYNANYRNLSTSGVRVQAFSNTGNLIDNPVLLTVHKQGADAKQSVQVYKSIPKVSENINTFTAVVTSASFLSENVSWLTSCTNSGVFGDRSCVINSGIFPNGAVCNATPATSLEGYSATASVSGNTLNVGVFLVDGNVNTTVHAAVSCTKIGSEFKLPTVQPILVNQVQYPLDRDGAKILNTYCNGTTQGCSDSGAWVSSITVTGGNATINFDTSVTGGNAGICWFQDVFNTVQTAFRMTSSGPTSIIVNMRRVDTYALVNGNFFLQCIFPQ